MKMEQVTFIKNIDNRYLPRWTTQLRALYQTSKDSKSRTGTIKDISCGGVCLAINHIINLHETMDLTISFSYGSCINVSGIVRWIKISDDQTLVGLKYLNMSSAVQEAILSNMIGKTGANLRNFWFRDWNNDKN